MDMKVRVRRVAVRFASLLLAGAGTARAMAATLEVSVVDEQGRGIENVAVYAMPARGEAPPPAATPTAVMDQQQLQFVPHLLVVQAGTSVTFPNSDHVSHHVYSFSKAKAFELPLYKGDMYPPVVFENAGVVVLGCNIHDGMLGYIVVVDTPHFGRTDERGVALLDGVPSGDYAVSAWTPRVRASGLPAAQKVAVEEAGGTLEIEIAGRLAPPHGQGNSSLSWERY